MFGSKRSVPKEIGSLVGVGTTVHGDVVFSGGLRIDGTVQGSVRCIDGDAGGILVVSETGVVEGGVRAAHVVVAGCINGPVMASELVELQPKARVNGDVSYRAIEMHHGAIVQGKLAHGDAGTELAGRSAAPLKLAPALPRTDGEASAVSEKTGDRSG
jgi:cytoskeletal protein CcmA (bactofilin family)